MEEYESKAPRCFRRSWIVLIVLTVLAILCIYLMTAVYSKNPTTVEMNYSRGFYKTISAVLGGAFGWLGVSVGEILIYLAVLFAVFSVVALVINIVRLRWTALITQLLSLVCAASFVGLLFYGLWGLNYSRLPLADSLGLDVKERSAQELYELCGELAKDAGTYRAALGEREDGTVAYPMADLLAPVPSYYAKLGTKYSFFSAGVLRPKPVLWSEGLSCLGITGVYFPFTGESNVNVHQPELLIPATAAHECAHQLGIAREDEANFVAYLACMASGDTFAEYSGTVLALIYCGNALHDADSELYSSLRDSYSEGLSRDLDMHNAYWKNYEGPAQELASDTNDGYLKLNGQDDGIKSYGRMVDLMLAARENDSLHD